MMYSITKLLIIPFTQKWKSFKYNACLAITRVIRGMSEGKLRQELCLESLQLCRWYRKVCSFYKVFKTDIQNTFLISFQLQELWAIFPSRQSITFSKILFFPSAIIELNNLDPSLRKSECFNL